VNIVSALSVKNDQYDAADLVNLLRMGGLLAVWVFCGPRDRYIRRLPVPPCMPAAQNLSSRPLMLRLEWYAR
jgi:hypothetical protein